MAPERCIIASFLIGFCVVMLGNPHAAPGRDHERIFFVSYRTKLRAKSAQQSA